MPLPTVSTSWAETIADDEAARFERYAEDLRAIQRDVAARAGGAKLRALHAKGLAGVEAELAVLGISPSTRAWGSSPPRRSSAPTCASRTAPANGSAIESPTCAGSRSRCWGWGEEDHPRDGGRQDAGLPPHPERRHAVPERRRVRGADQGGAEPGAPPAARDRSLRAGAHGEDPVELREGDLASESRPSRRLVSSARSPSSGARTRSTTRSSPTRPPLRARRLRTTSAQSWRGAWAQGPSSSTCRCSSTSIRRRPQSRTPPSSGSRTTRRSSRSPG